jgi:hypothetical protein
MLPARCAIQWLADAPSFRLARAADVAAVALDGVAPAPGDLAVQRLANNSDFVITREELTEAQARGRA